LRRRTSTSIGWQIRNEFVQAQLSQAAYVSGFGGPVFGWRKVRLTDQLTDAVRALGDEFFSASGVMTELILLRRDKIGAGSRLDVMCITSVSSRVGARSQGGNPDRRNSGGCRVCPHEVQPQSHKRLEGVNAPGERPKLLFSTHQLRRPCLALACVGVIDDGVKFSGHSVRRSRSSACPEV
jgi:hypothetical protein